jgi:small-conductance mechanosensitive channel
MKEYIMAEGHLDKLITIAIIVVVFAGLISITNRIFRRINRRKNSIFYKFLNSVVYVVLLATAIYSVLSQFDMAREISTVILQSGTLIIAVSTFAAQQALGNVISGFMLSASRPLEIGQKVKLLQGGTQICEGIVKDMTFRHVVIQSYDGQSNIIPNSLVDQAVIVNADYVEGTGNFLEFEVAYESDFDLVRSLIRQALESQPEVSRKDVNIMMNRISPNGVVFKFTVWTNSVDENFRACSELREKIIKAFNEHHVIIPYQTIDLYTH